MPRITRSPCHRCGQMTMQFSMITWYMDPYHPGQWSYHRLGGDVGADSVNKIVYLCDDCTLTYIRECHRKPLLADLFARGGALLLSLAALGCALSHPPLVPPARILCLTASVCYLLEIRSNAAMRKKRERRKTIPLPECSEDGIAVQHKLGNDENNGADTITVAFPPLLAALFGLFTQADYFAYGAVALSLFSALLLAAKVPYIYKVCRLRTRRFNLKRARNMAVRYFFCINPNIRIW